MGILNSHVSQIRAPEQKVNFTGSGVISVEGVRNETSLVDLICCVFKHNLRTMILDMESIALV